MSDMEDYFYYCTKCGWNTVMPRDKCPHCNIELNKYDCNTEDFFDLSDEEREKLQATVEEIIANSPDFDPVLRDERLAKEKRSDEELKRNMHRNRVTVTCPYCNSTDTRKISAGSRIISADLFGLASSNLGKQWHCRNCGSDF
ncbi:hypothetical protein [Diplocloster hominis]|uniref:hypothetical protein n=1 Tax=Diplocloster hominis TaxID=3079010 RepID=UPI0031BA0382